jgi:hypothetical protein
MLLTSSDLAQGGRFKIVLPGLPAFNAGDYAFVVEKFEHWDDGPAVQSVMVANGGGPGAVAVDPWMPSESYYVLAGSIEADAAAHPGIRRSLLAAVTPDADAAVRVTDLAGEEFQVFVRVYDRRSIDSLGNVLTFSLPLVAPDPYKYGVTALTAQAGGFEPEDWFRVYTDDAGNWYRTYAADGAVHYRSYIEDDAVAATSLPASAVITSPGDAVSKRVTMTVQGPIAIGEWYIEGDDGSRIWVDTSLAAGQSLILDTAERTATLNGSPVDHLVYGDFQTLQPGLNSWRLVVAASGSGSSMNVSALPANL